jgi:hypothetical protein
VQALPNLGEEENNPSHQALQGRLYFHAIGQASLAGLENYSGCPVSLPD